MTTSLSELLSADQIVLNPRWQTRKQTLQEITGAAAHTFGLDDRELYEAVLERERLGSTGFGEGVAIPHARISGVDRPVGFFARLREPVDWQAIDDRPCDLVFLLLAPHDAGADHLRALARVSRVFREANTRTALRRAPTVEAVLATLCPNETNHDAA